MVYAVLQLPSSLLKKVITLINKAIQQLCLVLKSPGLYCSASVNRKPFHLQTFPNFLHL